MMSRVARPFAVRAFQPACLRFYSHITEPSKGSQYSLCEEGQDQHGMTATSILELGSKYAEREIRRQEREKAPITSQYCDTEEGGQTQTPPAQIHTMPPSPAYSSEPNLV